MTIKTYAKTNANALLFVFVFLPVNTTFGWPIPVTSVEPAPDPTTPSSKIAERIELENVTSQKTQPTNELPKKPNLNDLRLRAIVLRDNDHGTALVSLGDTENYVIRLLRSNRISVTNVVNIGGTRVVIKGFSDSWIIMRSLDTDEQFIIN